MHIPTTKKDQESFLQIHSLLNELTSEQVKVVFERLLTVLILSYLDNKSLRIPHIGDLHIEYEGDTIDEGLRKANLSISVEPTEFLRKLIGQVEDTHPKRTDLDKIEIDKILLELSTIINS